MSRHTCIGDSCTVLLCVQHTCIVDSNLYQLLSCPGPGSPVTVERLPREQNVLGLNPTQDSSFIPLNNEKSCPGCGCVVGLCFVDLLKYWLAMSSCQEAI